MKILFNEIAPKCIFSVLHALGVTYIVAPGGGGGHKIFDHQIGGSKNIAEVLSEIYDPPIPKKMVAPSTIIHRVSLAIKEPVSIFHFFQTFSE